MKNKLPVSRFDYEGEILTDDGKNNILIENKINGILFDNIINNRESAVLLDLFNEQNKIPVGIDGIVANFKEEEKVHSFRATLFSKNLAQGLFERIQSMIPSVEGYTAIGVNESFRFIEYTQGGVLIPHYDGKYQRNEKEQSFYSLIIYLKVNKAGKTEFVKENREDHDYSDWKNMAKSEDIIETVIAKKNSALLFKHNLLHQSSENVGNKIIIRTDIMFRKEGV